MTQAECAKKYGSVSNGHWDEEQHWCALVELPPEVQQCVINSATGGAWIHVYCNKDLAKPLLRALQNVIDRGLLYELKTFDGCFQIRHIRGSSTETSAHSWGLAIDLNAAENPLGSESSWSIDFVFCFLEAGFTWGGNFSRKDPMHFSLAGF